MQMSEVALLLFGALLSNPQEVQYRCPKPEGGVVVQRTPCEGAARRQELVRPPEAAVRPEGGARVQRTADRGREGRSPQESRQR